MTETTSRQALLAAARRAKDFLQDLDKPRIAGVLPAIMADLDKAINWAISDEEEDYINGIEVDPAVEAQFGQSNLDRMIKEHTTARNNSTEPQADPHALAANFINEVIQSQPITRDEAVSISKRIQVDAEAARNQFHSAKFPKITAGVVTSNPSICWKEGKLMYLADYGTHGEWLEVPQFSDIRK